MRVTRHWLSSFFGQPFTADEIQTSLLSVGIEIEETTAAGQGLDDVVVGCIESFIQHPDADKLSLCKINDGTEIFDVVCGAKNFKQGDKVAFARIGAKLPNGLHIKKSKIRGVTSFGMLCSASELGLNEEADGILILPTETLLGTQVKEVLGLDDDVFVLELTPNRGDCWSHVGVAMELAAATQRSINILPERNLSPMSANYGCEVMAPEACPYYSLTLIEGVDVHASAQVTQTRLTLVGQRPKNNLVDATNFVMVERGQPLHAFDADKVQGSIHVRFAQKNEKLLCLDEVERRLLEEDLVIADDSGAIALAGIMGGLSTAVSTTTKNILLEGAWFTAQGIRSTSKRLHLSTESSKRYERDIDGANVLYHTLMAAGMIVKSCKGAQMKGTQEVGKQALDPHAIVVHDGAIEKVLGIKIPNAHEYLTRLGFGVEKMGDGWKVGIPPRRPEIKREIDVIEEIARIYGYTRIPSSIPQLDVTPQLNAFYHQRLGLKRKLAGLGLNEIFTDSFMNGDHEIAFGSLALGKAVAIQNPIVSHKAVMKTSLMPNLLDAWVYNHAHQLLKGAFFEIDKVFGKNKKELLEQERLGILLSGIKQPSDWKGSDMYFDYFDAKAIAESLGTLYGHHVLFEKTQENAFLHPGQACNLLLEDKVIGCMGVLHPEKAHDYQLDQDVILIELQTGALLLDKPKAACYQAVSPYPCVRRDLAFVVKGDVTYSEVQKALRTLKLSILSKYHLFDQYTGKGIDKGHQSLAIRFEFSSKSKTLKDKEVDKTMTKIAQALETQVAAVMRG